MMYDDGMGLRIQRDLLETAGAYLDLAKISVGTSRLLSEKILKEKVRIYEEHQVNVFPGGQFLEYAIFHQGIDVVGYYFEEVCRVGYRTVEISTNNLNIDIEEKVRLIRMAEKEFGLTVLGEVGAKETSSLTSELIREADLCLRAGSWKVLVEAAELTRKEDGAPIIPVIEEMGSTLNISEMIFELPGVWIPNVHSHQIFHMGAMLIELIGCEVNVGNVAPERILELETLRTGLGTVLV